MPLLPHHTEPREVLLSYADFGVDSLNLVGLTEPALRHLEDHDVCPDFAALGLTIAPLRACHIEAVIALRQAVFKRQPEACWFGATDAHIPGLRLALQEACQVQGSLHKVILEGSTVRGVLGCDVEEHALWGHSGGMDLVLAPPLQGRGLIKTGYRTLLRELAARSVNRFHGSSSQPGVLALGARMGRQFTGLSIRKATPRPQDWFRPWTKHYGST